MKSSEDNEGPLNIQAKSILNPSMKDSSGFLNKIALQNKSNTNNKKGSNSSSSDGSDSDQFVIETLKELSGKMQSGDWRMRLEGEE